VSNSKPTAQLPTEQAVVTTDKPSTTTGEPKEQDHAVHATSQQQNANDQEDIFSPLRESMFCIFLKVISNYFETSGVMCFFGGMQMLFKINLFNRALCQCNHV